MLIRSQDKRLLYNIEANKGVWIVDLSDGGLIIGVGLDDLGKYSSLEKAIKVLDMIGCAWENQSERFKYVFQMPQDEEVEA